MLFDHLEVFKSGENLLFAKQNRTFSYLKQNDKKELSLELVKQTVLSTNISYRFSANKMRLRSQLMLQLRS